MIKRLLSRAVPEEEWPVWALPSVIFGGFCSAVFCFICFTSAPAFVTCRAWPMRRPMIRACALEIGGTLFSVPAHYTRNGRTRRSGQLDHASLHVLLPDFSPWREDRAEAFLDTGILSKLLTINIRATASEMPEERIFNAIYRPYINGSGEVTDEGLQSFAFRSDSPYGKKQIFRGLKTGSAAERQRPPLFICDIVKHENPTCESRFNLGTTAQVSYVFKRVHLAQWEAIDRDVREMIRNFRAAARRQN